MSGKNTKDHTDFRIEFFDIARKLRDMSEHEFRDVSSQIAQVYARRNWPENDDPQDDFNRILNLIFYVRIEVGQLIDESQPLKLPKPEPKGSGTSNSERMVNYFSNVLHTIAPILSVARWKILLSDLFSAKYGGNMVRIKKNPGDQKRGAAKGLTIKEIQEILGVSRTYAYKLYREVNKTAKK